MNRIFVDDYRELSKLDEHPSIREFFMAEKYPQQDEIVRYLKRGTLNLASPGWTYDVITGKKIPGTNRLLNRYTKV